MQESLEEVGHTLEEFGTTFWRGYGAILPFCHSAILPSCHSAILPFRQVDVDASSTCLRRTREIFGHVRDAVAAVEEEAALAGKQGKGSSSGYAAVMQRGYAPTPNTSRSVLAGPVF